MSFFYPQISRHHLFIHFPLNSLGTFVVNYFTIYARVHFWALYCVPLVCSLRKYHTVLILYCSYQFSSVQSLSRVWLFATPWTAALSIANSQILLKLMSIESVMPSNHLILCCPLLLLSSIFPNQDPFKWVSSSHQVAKILEFQLQHQSFQWTPRTNLL